MLRQLHLRFRNHLLLYAEAVFVKRNLSYLQRVLNFPRGSTPALVLSYNNPSYLQGMINQLRHRGLDPIVVVDSASTSSASLDLLDQLDSLGIVTLRLPRNFGPHFIQRNLHMFTGLPDYFILTDPDLALNPAMPGNFVQQLIDVSVEFRIGKVGVALSLDRIDLPDQATVRRILQWETPHWSVPLVCDQDLELFVAAVDTTFCLVNKKAFDLARPYEGIRVGGDFTAHHLPWDRKTWMPVDERHEYRRRARYSNWT